MVAKIYTDDQFIYFEVLHEDDVPNKLVVCRSGRLGTVVLDTANNLHMTEDAQLAIKNLINNADRCYDDLNAFDWWLCDNQTYAMAWFGGNIKIPKDIKIEVNHNLKFVEGGFIR